VKLFVVELQKTAELVVLAENADSAYRVAEHNSSDLDEFGVDWETSGSCFELTEKNKRMAADWLLEAPSRDLTEPEMFEIFGDYDPSVQSILDFFTDQEKERLAAEAADRQQTKLPL